LKGTAWDHYQFTTSCHAR